MASLIQQQMIKSQNNLKIKVIADEDSKTMHIIKGLALGADYVMLGSILNKSIESSELIIGTILEFIERQKSCFLMDLKSKETEMSTKEVQESKP